MSHQNAIGAISLDRLSVHRAYAAGKLSPTELIDEIYRRIAAQGDDHVWLHLVPHAEARRRAAALEQHYARLPKPALYGLPYGLKDNIHVAGLPTTAGCTALHAIASESATVVNKLDAAGAILIGKQNLDQFATGLVGIRNPSGYCRNAFDPDYIPGGSSSGSAVAVAKGLVSFSIGSDTGGSGRVPAALNNIVGLKATPGLVSNHGFLCNNRTFDVAPVFALTIPDANAVLEVITGHDPQDPFSSSHRPLPLPAALSGDTFRFAVPEARQLEFFGDRLAETHYEQALATLRKLGGTPVEIDFAPFIEASDTIFKSPFIAERAITYRPIADTHPAAIDPSVLNAIQAAAKFSAEDTFRSLYRLTELRHSVQATLAGIDVLALPTAGTIYRCAEVEADPVRLNANMGYYTYFANPLHLSVVSVPAGIRADGLPFGLSLVAGPWREKTLEHLGQRFHLAIGGRLGATATALADIQ